MRKKASNFPHRTPEDSISLPPGVDFRDHDRVPRYKSPEEMWMAYNPARSFRIFTEEELQQIAESEQ